jgi:hypothetical protein
MFRGAAIYGVVVLLPLYFMPPPADRPDVYYGFIGVGLVFQWLFWIVGGDPVRFRAFMLPAVTEKLVFAVPALALVAEGRAPRLVVPFAVMDLLLGTGFLVARSRTPA